MFQKKGIIVSRYDTQTPSKLADQAGTTFTASVSALAIYTRTFNWTINKTVTPDHWDLFRGGEGVSKYSITVTKDAGTDSTVIKGQVCVSNGGATKVQRNTVNTWATTLDNFNNGLIGPGHCSESEIPF